MASDYLRYHSSNSTLYYLLFYFFPRRNLFPPPPPYFFFILFFRLNKLQTRKAQGPVTRNKQRGQETQRLHLLPLNLPLGRDALGENESEINKLKISHVVLKNENVYFCYRIHFDTYVLGFVGIKYLVQYELI